MICQFIDQMKFKIMFINVKALAGKLKAPSKNSFGILFWIN